LQGRVALIDLVDGYSTTRMSGEIPRTVAIASDG
jgi:hypothetical protein